MKFVAAFCALVLTGLAVGPALAADDPLSIEANLKYLEDNKLKKGVIVRPTHGFGATGAVRVTVGTPEEHELLAGALTKVLAPA